MTWVLFLLLQTGTYMVTPMEPDILNNSRVCESIGEALKLKREPQIISSFCLEIKSEDVGKFQEAMKVK